MTPLNRGDSYDTEAGERAERLVHRERHFQVPGRWMCINNRAAQGGSGEYDHLPARGREAADEVLKGLCCVNWERADEHKHYFDLFAGEGSRLDEFAERTSALDPYYGLEQSRRGEGVGEFGESADDQSKAC
jgi:hypothetical protein